MDTRLPVDVAVYAYSSYQYNKMNESALPAVAFTVVMENPTDENMTASFMMNLPIGVIPNMKSVHEPMKPPTSAPSSERQERSGAGSSPNAQSKRFSFEDDVDRFVIVLYTVCTYTFSVCVTVCMCVCVCVCICVCMCVCVCVCVCVCMCMCMCVCVCVCVQCTCII